MCRIRAKSYHKGVCKHRYGPGNHRRRIWIPRVNELGIDGRGMALHDWWLSARSGRWRAGPRMTAVQRERSFSCTHLAGTLARHRHSRKRWRCEVGSARLLATPLSISYTQTGRLTPGSAEHHSIRWAGSWCRASKFSKLS